MIPVLVFIFIIAAFLGFELISKVPSQLHTPLMSGSNAISGITIIGAMLSVATPSPMSSLQRPRFLAERHRSL